jgi:hypothetical protein
MTSETAQQPFLDIQNLESQDSLRKSALLIHSLHPDDRDWMLSNLSQQQSSALLSLTAELDMLGIPKQSSLLSVLETKKERATVSARTSTVTLLENLNSKQLQALANILSAEPVGLITYFLRSKRWVWHEQLLEMLDASKRRQVQDEIKTKNLNALTAPPLMLVTQLENSLTSRIQSLSESNEPEIQPSASFAAWKSPILSSLLQSTRFLQSNKTPFGKRSL